MKSESQSVIKDVSHRVVIAPTSSVHLELVTKIAERVYGTKAEDITYSSMNPRSFSVGEFCPRFSIGGEGQPKNLQGKSVYITLLPGPFKDAEALMYRAGIVAQAAWEAGAENINFLATDLPHSRQDRGWKKDDKSMGEPTTARLNARFLLRTARAKSVITTHVHSPRIAAFYALESGLVHKKRPDLLPEEAKAIPLTDLVEPDHVDFDNREIQALGAEILKPISPHAFLADYLLHHSSLEKGGYLENRGAKLALRGVDQGNNQFVVEDLYRALWLPEATLINGRKFREAKNDSKSVRSEISEIKTNLANLNETIEILADDGCDTGGSLIHTARQSNAGNSFGGKNYGAPGNRLVYFTHAWLGGKAYEASQRRLIDEIKASEFVTSNTRPYISGEQYYRFKEKSTVLRFAGLWADAILANEMGHDVSTRYQEFSSQEEQHQFLAPLYVLKRHSLHFLVNPEEERRKIVFNLRK